MTVSDGADPKDRAQERLRGVSATAHVVLLVPSAAAPGDEPDEPPQPR